MDIVNGLSALPETKLALLLCGVALVVVFKALHVIERLRAKGDDK
jgi:hypothetical protein